MSLFVEKCKEEHIDEEVWSDFDKAIGRVLNIAKISYPHRWYRYTRNGQLIWLTKQLGEIVLHVDIKKLPFL